MCYSYIILKLSNFLEGNIMVFEIVELKKEIFIGNKVEIFEFDL